MTTASHPPLPSPHIARPRLTEQLLRQRLALVVAPAGYGKSTLLHEAVLAAGAAAVYHCLGAADRSADHLLAGLAAALAAPPPAAGGVPALCRWLDRPGRPTVLALDGLEWAPAAAGADQLLSDLVAGAPPGLRLWLAGRRLPRIPALLPLRLAGAVVEIGARDLLFTAAETSAYLALVGAGRPAADRAPDAIADLAGGWPAALRLLSRAPAPDWDDFFAYCGQVVAEALSPAERRTLADLALLNDWRPQAYNWLLDRNDGERALRAWERALPVDRQGRLHPLLRRYFAAHPDRDWGPERDPDRDPDRERALHRRAALWQAEQGEPDTALTHAVAAGDIGLAAPLLRQAGARLLEQGQTAALEDLLNRMPAAILEATPDLLLRAGEALRQGGAPERAVRWLRTAAVGFAADGDGSGLYRAFCRLVLAHADRGEWGELQAAIRQIEDEANGAAGRDRAEALRALAEYELARGQSEPADARLREAAALFRADGDDEGAGITLARLGAGALVALGRLDEALSALREAQRLIGGAAACRALLAEVEILVHRGRWSEAEHILAGATAVGGQDRARSAWLQVRLALERGDLEQARRLRDGGDLAEARCLRAGRDLPAAPTAGGPVLQGYAGLAAGWIALAEGNAAAALACGRQTVRLAAHVFPLLQLAAQDLIAQSEAQIGRPEALPTVTPAAPIGRPGALETSPPPAGRLRAECFGAFRLFRDELLVPPNHWGRAQVRSVFQYLLLQPGFAAAREVLLETFWPEEPPVQSRARLRVTINRLRSALQRLGCGLETGKDLICLPSTALIRVDLLDFRSALAAARRLVSQDPAAALEHCRAGCALYRGPLLADAFWPGVEEHRLQAERERIELLQLWQAAAVRAGRTEEAITVLEDLLALEPGREEESRQLIRLLIQSGRRGDAVRRYHALATWLRRELGMSPSPETQALFRQALG